MVERSPRLSASVLSAVLSLGLASVPRLCWCATAGPLEVFQAAIATAEPGSVVELAGGRYSTPGAIMIAGRSGTEEKPITLRATTRGKAVIAGHAGFVLQNCAHVVIEGFVFENDADQHAILLENCRHVRVTRCLFRLAERPKPRRMEHWLYVTGSHSGRNRIDHNRFKNKGNSGSPVFVRGDDATLTASQHDRIDHNHFLDVRYANDSNGHETLRTGSNDLGASGRSSFTLIEHNLFERCSGEQEIVSLKSSGNIVRGNTFIDCRGSICLRLGNRNEVTGNIMLNPRGIAGAGGIKIYGFEHRVTGNWFEGLTGTGHEAPLALIPGTMDTETTGRLGEKYDSLTSAPATRTLIENNVWLDCASLIFGNEKADSRRQFTPSACQFSGNIVAHTQTVTVPLVNLGLVRNLRAAGNIGWPAETGNQPWQAWFRWKDPVAGGLLPRVSPLTTEEAGPDAP